MTEWTNHQGDLQKTAQFVLVLYAGFWVHETAVVGDGAVTADEDVVGDGLPEDLDLEDIGNYLLRLAVDVGVDEGDIVVACNDIAEG